MDIVIKAKTMMEMAKQREGLSRLPSIAFMLLGLLADPLVIDSASTLA